MSTLDNALTLPCNESSHKSRSRDLGRFRLISANLHAATSVFLFLFWPVYYAQVLFAWPCIGHFDAIQCWFVFTILRLLFRQCVIPTIIILFSHSPEIMVAYFFRHSLTLLIVLFSCICFLLCVRRIYLLLHLFIIQYCISFNLSITFLWNYPLVYFLVTSTLLSMRLRQRLAWLIMSPYYISQLF